MRYLTLLILALSTVAQATPILHSLPGATHTLYIDTDGDNTPTWGSYAPGVTPAYTGNVTDLWARVAEKFGPFNVDVTTVDAGTHEARVVVGGDGNWAGGVGGISAVSSYLAPNLPQGGFVFPSRVGNVAEAVAHEAGHQFGLLHQALYDSSGNFVTRYNPGNAAKAPVMGNSYNAARGLWWLGNDELYAGHIQDDVATLAAVLGLVADEPATTPIKGMVSGTINSLADTDAYTFHASGLTTIAASVAAVGPTLDLKLDILDSRGVRVAGADTASLGEMVTVNLPDGDYTAVVGSHGAYGDLGTYTVAVTTPEPGFMGLAMLTIMAGRRRMREVVGAN